VCAVLLYLATDGWSLLDIPAGKEETMIVIGYIVIGDVRMVLYLEHEMEEGRPEEVHIHLAGSTNNFWTKCLSCKSPNLVGMQTVPAGGVSAGRDGEKYRTRNELSCGSTKPQLDFIGWVKLCLIDSYMGKML